MDHSQIPTRLTNAAFGRLQAFCMYGGIGMSTPSLHGESTDSLMHGTIRNPARGGQNY